MARTLEFNQSEALNKAIALFWCKGYQAASLSQLLQVMEISRSSFYATFGDKRSLYLECLDIFGKRTKDILQQARKENPPLQALRFFFDYTVTTHRGQRSELGCMMVNTVLELAGVDDDLSARASNLLAEMQTEFERCLLEAGLAPKRAAEFASFLMLFNQGLRVSCRRKVSHEQQLSDIDSTFRLIGSAI